MSNAPGPAQLVTAKRWQWARTFCVIWVVGAIGSAAAGGWVGAVFCAVLAIPFAVKWLGPQARERPLRDVLLGGLLGDRFWLRWAGLLLISFAAQASAPKALVTSLVEWAVILLIPARLLYKRGGHLGRSQSAAPGRELMPSTVRELHDYMARRGGGCYIAGRHQGELLAAPSQAAVLVLAGPRKGKSSCVVTPAIAAHPGAVVSTSTKLELLNATLPIRQELGDCWYADLTNEGVPAGCKPLRYSPLVRAADWDQAMIVADAMTRAVEGSSQDKPHWKERAGALLACCLHAAAVSERSMRDVLNWIMRHDGDTPLAELEPTSIAHSVLYGIVRTDREERSGIFSTAARVLQAYRSESALALADEPNFDPDVFARSRDTLYIAAPGERQRLLAPLVVGLLVEIRQARYRAQRLGTANRFPLLMALDEARNIAPIHDLPMQLSEGGGQGVQTMVVLQSLSQAKAVWREEGESLMDFTDAVVILGGVSDKNTCETISRKCGHWDRPIQTVSEQRGAFILSTVQPTRSEGWTTRREARIPPDQVAAIELGQALVIVGAGWEYVPTLPYDRHPCFSQVLAHAQQHPGQAYADIHGITNAVTTARQRELPKD